MNFGKTKCCPAGSTEQWDKSCKCDSSSQKLSNDGSKCIDKCPKGWNACASQCCPPGSSEKHGHCVVSLTFIGSSAGCRSRSSVTTRERRLLDLEMTENAATTALLEPTSSRPNAALPIHSRCTVNANATIRPNDPMPTILDVNPNAPNPTNTTPTAYAANLTSSAVKTVNAPAPLLARLTMDRNAPHALLDRTTTGSPKDVMLHAQRLVLATRLLERVKVYVVDLDIRLATPFVAPLVPMKSEQVVNAAKPDLPSTLMESVSNPLPLAMVMDTESEMQDPLKSNLATWQLITLA